MANCADKFTMKREKISKEKIIAAFLEESFRNTIVGTSLSDIANGVGIKKASLYNYYPNREAIEADTIHYCSSILFGVSFVPKNVESGAKSRSARSLLCTMCVRFFRIFQKSPHFLALSFIENAKLFSSKSVEISRSFKRSLFFETNTAFSALKSAGKIKKIADSEQKSLAELFSISLFSLLLDFISEKQSAIRAGEDIALSEEKLVRLVSDFCSILEISPKNPPC